MIKFHHSLQMVLMSAVQLSHSVHLIVTYRAWILPFQIHLLEHLDFIDALSKLDKVLKIIVPGKNVMETLDHEHHVDDAK